MRKLHSFLLYSALLVGMLAALALPFAVQAAGPAPGAAASAPAAQGSGCDRMVIGGVCTVAEGETLGNSIVIIGGTMIVAEGGRVNGDVTLTGGTLRIAGLVNGDIVATGGLVTLEETAEIKGDINLADARLDRESGARVDGRIRTNASGPFRFTSSDGFRFSPLQVSLDPLWQMLSFLFRAFLWAALAILVVLFLPRHTQIVAQGALRQPVLVAGVGLLTVVLAAMLLVVLALTLIGIPVAAFGLLLVAAAWAFGLIALGVEIGARLSTALKQDWALPVSAGIGTFLLVTITGSLGHFIWFGDWLLPALVGILGLGAVTLTRFGTQPYPPAVPSAQAPPHVPTIPPPSGGVA
jgi:hypothetical protein